MKRLLTALAVILAVLAPSCAAFADGILTIPGGPEIGQLLPLVGVNVTVEIHNQAAITTVRNTFLVESDDTTNTVYHYRLPAAASVTGFGVWRNDSLQMFDLRPGQAGGHDTAGIGHQDANLVEYLGSNPFVIGLRATPPGVFMTELKYVQLLSYDFGVVQYDYPLFTSDYLLGGIDTISIYGTYESQRSVLEIAGNYADNLQINTDDEYHGAFSLDLTETRPEEDLRLTLNYNQEDIGAWILTHRTNRERSGYFMLIIDPGIVDTAESVPKYFTFVIDRSGSMGGLKIAQARRAILRCLDNLLQHDHFNIIDFSSDIRHFRDEMVIADAENIQAARNYVSGIREDNMTDIYGALMQAVGQEMAEETANQIIFATDGLPTAGQSTNRDVILHDVTEANRFNARIYSFGIGRDVDARFLTALSEANAGETILFDPNAAPVDSIVDEFYSRQSRPALVDPVIEFSGGLESDSVYPPRLQNVAAGKQLYLFGRYSSFGDFDVNLSGRMAGGDTTLNFDRLAFPEEEAGNAFVPRLWAKSVIDYWIMWMVINGENQTVIDKIIELSLEYGILTKYTGFNDPDDPPPPPPDSGGNAIYEPNLAQFRAFQTIGGTELTWTVTGISAAMTYNIYKAPSPAGPWIKLNDFPLSERRFFDATGKLNEVAYYRIEAFFNDQRWESGPLWSGMLPTVVNLSDPYPNPFNTSTTITFDIPKAASARLALYSLDGREVMLVTNKQFEVGTHEVSIDAGGLPAGTYLLQLKVGEVRLTRKIVLLK